MNNFRDYLNEASTSVKQYGKNKLKKQMHKKVDQYVNSLEDMSDMADLDFFFSDLAKRFNKIR